MFTQKPRGASDHPASASAGAVDRPRAATVGLALGGGAARGWAHIGVLKRLDQIGIRPQVVVGTSIGAVVGGAWSAGRLTELEVFARGLTKRSMISMMDFHLAGSGLLSGDKLRRALDERFRNQQIEDLPVKFAAVATELRSGHEVWLTRGSITEAMRSSYALPGIFVPVLCGGRWLMDGALSNPVPVSVARALGADIVIAVNLHTDVLGRATVLHEHGSDVLPDGFALDMDETGQSLDDASRKATGLLAPVLGVASRMRQHLASNGSADGRTAAPSESAPGILSVILDAFNVTQDRIARSRLAGDPPDITVSPKIGGVGLSEFHRAEEAIKAGEVALDRVADDITDLLKATALRRRK